MKLVDCNRLRRKSGAAMVGLMLLGGWAGGLLSFSTAAEPSPAPAKQSAAASEVQSRPDGWRYVLHNNQWWYYTASQRWLVYRDGSWQHYAPQADGTAWNSGARSRRSYSRSPSGATIYNPDLYTPYFGPPERIWLFRRLYGHDPI